MKIAILGQGACGTAFGHHFSRSGYEVSFNKINGARIILVCVPSYAVISTLSNLQKDLTDQKIIICSKGFASGEKLLSEALKERFDNKIFFLYGPSLASEIESGELTRMVLAGYPSADGGKEEIRQLAKELESENLHIELSDDVIGVQVGATLKNVVTIFVGIAKGAGYGENAQAFILTRGLQEIQRFGLALGAKWETFSGLTCVGDLILHSRNRILGIELGKGRKLDEILKDIHVEHTLEGITAIKNARIMARKNNIEVPFIETLHSIIFEDQPMAEAIESMR